MAVSPKDLLKKDVVESEKLALIEKHVDKVLREHQDLRANQATAVSFEILGITINEATAKALQRLYEKAGWKSVQVNNVHQIITMTFPAYRATR